MNPNLKKPKYSVIMLIYNRTDELVQMARDCVQTVHNYSKDYELIIVDNGSTVRYPWEKECSTYIRFDKNMGISHGWNAGLKAARGKYLTIIGDDVMVLKNWLEGMEEAINMPDAGMANPHVEHLPAGIGIKENYKWPSGACFMLKPETIEKAGYFREDLYFPCNFEDYDYWMRIYKAGLKIYRNYQVTVRHREGATLHSPDLSATFQANRMAFLKEWGIDPVPIFCGNDTMPIYEKA